jgi:predicted ribosome quality control (RQC) complex YloA/Tae2 family protein
MSSDIVKRLREKINTTCNEAADRIEALEGERDKLKWSMEWYEERAEKAEARAERLRVALDGIAANADAASDLPLFRVQCRDFARKALSEDKK